MKLSPSIRIWQEHPVGTLPSLDEAPLREPVSPRSPQGIEGLGSYKVVNIDQSPSGVPHAQCRHYTGVFDHIRELFAETAEAKMQL